MAEGVGIQPLIDITALTLATAFVEDTVEGYRPVSLLFIAEPESGKTFTLTKFRKLKFVQYCNELTTKILINDLLPKIQTREIRFILIPDLLNCTEKQYATRMPFLNTMKSLIDEGLTTVLTPFKRYTWEKEAKCGLITAITAKSFSEIKGYLDKIGFLSRMVPFSYSYPINKIREILNYLEGDKVKEGNIKIPDLSNLKETKFKPKPELFKELEIIAFRLSNQYSGYGIRAMKNLKKLCYANALINGRKEITRADVEKILELGKWINFNFNPL